MLLMIMHVFLNDTFAHSQSSPPHSKLLSLLTTKFSRAYVAVPPRPYFHCLRRMYESLVIRIDWDEEFRQV